MTARQLLSADLVLSLQGGVGNQLFQWAFVRAQQHRGLEVALDTCRCRGDRPFELRGLVPPRMMLPRTLGRALVVAERTGMLGAVGLRPASEPGAGYHPDFVAGLPTRAYVRGYFQSPHYFTDVADSVSAEVLTHLRGFLTSSGRELADQLQDDRTSVAVHIRRGDYLSDATAAAKHGVLDQGYYDRALQRLDDNGASRRVWFSDDLPWVAEHLARPGDLLCPADAVTGAPGEIALMASCHSRVVANSSFSWWAGWLGPQPDGRRLVVAPQTWFAGRDVSTDALVPPDWLRC